MNFTNLGRLVAAAVLITIPLSVAGAADMAVKAIAPPPAAFNWTGFYIGGYAGGAEMDQAQTSDPCNKAFAGGLCTVGVTGNYNAVIPVNYDMTPGFVGGGRIGYNWQPNPHLLLGLENEFGYIHVSGSAIMNPFPGTGDTSANTRLGNWYDALTARIGMTEGQVMFFARGGGAWARETASVIDAVPAGATLNTTTSKTMAGWAAGGGLEYAIDPHWSFRADYLFLGLQPNLTNCGTGFLGGVAPIPGSFCAVTHTPGIQTITLGLNYHFH